MKNNELNLINELLKILQPEDNLLRIELMKKYQKISDNIFSKNNITLTDIKVRKKSNYLYNFLHNEIYSDEYLCLFAQGKKIKRISDRYDCENCKNSINYSYNNGGIRFDYFDINFSSKICLSCNKKTNIIFDLLNGINEYCKEKVISKAKDNNLFKRYAFLVESKTNELTKTARELIIIQIENIITDVYINFDYKVFLKKYLK